MVVCANEPTAVARSASVEISPIVARDVSQSDLGQVAQGAERSHLNDVLCKYLPYGSRRGIPNHYAQAESLTTPSFAQNRGQVQPTGPY
jgi:hypothetical protein